MNLNLSFIVLFLKILCITEKQIKDILLFRGAMRYLRILLFVFKRQKFNITVPAAFQNTAKRHPDRVALYFEDQSWTFKKVISKYL